MTSKNDNMDSVAAKVKAMANSTIDLALLLNKDLTINFTHNENGSLTIRAQIGDDDAISETINPERTPVTSSGEKGPGINPKTTADERAASRKKITSLLHGLGENLYLDVSKMTPMGEGINIISFQDVIDRDLFGNCSFGSSRHRFVSDNYTNYVRALVSFCGKDFTRIYSDKLSELRHLHPNW